MPEGLIIGVVTNATDPEGLARVKVSYPTLGDQLVSGWLPVLTPCAGKGQAASRGMFFQPDVGDEVIVGCIAGDLNQAIVLGALFNQVNKPPVQSEQQNDVYKLVSRAGSTLTFVDTEGSQSIELQDKAGNGLKISVDDESVTITAKKAITLSCAGKITIHGGSVEIQSDDGVAISATGSVSVKGGPEISANAGMIKLN
jgi:uncharacterized protein involved in type VI secretion and phage assembly